MAEMKVVMDLREVDRKISVSRSCLRMGSGVLDGSKHRSRDNSVKKN